MFRAVDGESVGQVQIVFDGDRYFVPRGVSVAAALLTITRKTRVTEEGESRGPFCMMGVCFECLVTIDGVMNRQGCMVKVREGMVIERRGVVVSGEAL